MVITRCWNQRISESIVSRRSGSGRPWDTNPRDISQSEELSRPQQQLSYHRFSDIWKLASVSKDVEMSGPICYLLPSGTQPEHMVHLRRVSAETAVYH